MPDGSPAEAARRPVLVACGVLREEIESLLADLGEPAEASFLDSALHIDLPRLQAALEQALARHAGRRVLLGYGACHPRIDAIAAQAGAAVLPVQNCIELVLGTDSFCRELSAGAFFLFEDWARRWVTVMTSALGPDPKLHGEIIRSQHTHILAIRTPRSGDFEAEAQAVAEAVGLPLRWREVGFEVLARTLRRSLHALTADEAT